MTEMIKSVDEQLSLDTKIIEEMKWELKVFGKDVVKYVFYSVDDSGKQTADIHKVNTFLDSIKDQEWNQLKDQKWDRLRMTAVQIKLVSLGYDLGSKKIDGWFGNATKSAIQKFQKDQEFAQEACDGLPGKETIKALLKAKPKLVELSKEEKADQQEKQLDQRLGENNPDNIPELENIYQNLDSFSKTAFDAWNFSITIGNYEYKKEKGEVVRFIPSKTAVELIKREHFLDKKWQSIKEVKKDEGKNSYTLRQSITMIPEIKDIYSNIEEFQKNNFELGLAPLNTETHIYSVKKGKITRTENWSQVPLLPKEEYFENGERKALKSEPKLSEKPKQKVDIEKLIAWVPEVQTIYKNLSFLSKVHFKTWNLSLSTDIYNYQIEGNTLVRTQKPKQSKFIELSKKEAWKEWKREIVS